MAKKASGKEFIKTPVSEGLVADLPIENNTTNIPTIFIDGAQGLSEVNGVVKINLFQVVQEFATEDPIIRPKRLTVGRLALSTQTLVELTTWLMANVKIPANAQKEPGVIKDADHD